MHEEDVVAELNLLLYCAPRWLDEQLVWNYDSLKFI